MHVLRNKRISTYKITRLSMILMLNMYTDIVYRHYVGTFIAML